MAVTVALLNLNGDEIWSIGFRALPTGRGFVHGTIAALNHMGEARNYQIRFITVTGIIQFTADDMNMLRRIVHPGQIKNFADAHTEWRQLIVTRHTIVIPQAVLRITPTGYIIPEFVTAEFLQGLFTALTAFNISYDTVLLSMIYDGLRFFTVEGLPLPKT